MRIFFAPQGGARCDRAPPFSDDGGRAARFRSLAGAGFVRNSSPSASEEAFGESSAADGGTLPYDEKALTSEALFGIYGMSDQGRSLSPMFKKAFFSQFKYSMTPSVRAY